MLWPLITEIEHMEMEKRTNHRLTLEEPTEKIKKWWGLRFPETPERIWSCMRGQDEEDPQMICHGTGTKEGGCSPQKGL